LQSKYQNGKLKIFAEDHDDQDMIGKEWRKVNKMDLSWEEAAVAAEDREL